MIHTAIFIAAMVLISLMSIWFGFGPLVHSAPLPHIVDPVAARWV